MYKYFKYLNESTKTIIQIILTIIIIFLMYNAMTLFYKNYLFNSVITHHMVLSKYIENGSLLKLEFDKKYIILTKDENNKLHKFITTDKEYNLIEENKSYIMKVKKNRLLHVNSKSIEQYALLNNLELKNIEITEEDKEIALSYKEGKKVTIMDNNNGNSNSENNNKDDSEMPISDNKEQSNEKIIKSRNFALKKEGITRISVKISDNKKYDSSILFDGNEYRCKEISKEIGSCSLIQNATLWEINPNNNIRIVKINILSNEDIPGYDIDLKEIKS